MANYKVCKSTRRIARVEVFPEGASKPLYVEVSEVKFYETGEYCETKSERVATFALSDYEQMYRILKCFGLEWRDTLGLSDALEILSCDYEERKADMSKMFTVMEV